MVLTFKCDNEYGIVYPKSMVKSGLRKKTISLKRVTKEFCDYNGKLPRNKIPKCKSIKRRKGTKKNSSRR